MLCYYNFRAMPKTEKKVNQKYCKLLSETFEKYSYINVKVLSRNSVKDKACEDPLSIQDVQVDKLNKQKSSSERNMKHYRNLRRKRYFSRDEDKIILDKIGNETMSLETVQKLSARLDRVPTSIKERVLHLKKHKLVGNVTRIEIENKRFTLQEDMLIIDHAFGHLKECGALEKASLTDPGALVLQLGRSCSTIRCRWKMRLKPWLLQYYDKTLNLEIRPMLTSLIAEKFDSVSSIDWSYLAKFPEFSGHSPESLANLFSLTITRILEKLDVSRTELTLPQIAEASKMHFNNSKVKKSTEKRQQEVIKYFEELVNRDGITKFI